MENKLSIWQMHLRTQAERARLRNRVAIVLLLSWLNTSAKNKKIGKVFRIVGTESPGPRKSQVGINVETGKEGVS